MRHYVAYRPTMNRGLCIETSCCSLISGIYELLSDNFLLVADENEIVQIDSDKLDSYWL